MKNIPEICAPDLYTETAFSNSAFVRLSDCAEFDIKLQYPLMNLKTSVSECYVREEVLEKLLIASKALPKGIRFRILDTWRPIALQFELYECYSRDIIKKFGLENESEEKQKEVIRGFVSYPENNVQLPPVHTTGGAVDITLIDVNGEELAMGMEFDSFSERTETSYYETHSIDSEIRDNRRILYNVMVGAGFTNLPSEWWHYDYGDRFWAYYTKRPAIYEGVFTVDDLKLCNSIKR